MHHPPLSTGVPVWDELGLPAADRSALAEVVERHRQVRRLVAGHVHRTITGELAGRAVLTVPSTYVQARLDFCSEEIELAAEPAGFAVHAVRDGRADLTHPTRGLATSATAVCCGFAQRARLLCIEGRRLVLRARTLTS
jgi:hypothetical protein